MSDLSSGLQGTLQISLYFMKDYIEYYFRSLGLDGSKKEEAKESGNGMDIFLYSCAALMVAALNRKKTVNMV